MRLAIPRVSGGKNNRKQAAVLNFLIRLNIFAIPLYAILALNLSLVQLQELVAQITYRLLGAAGMEPSMNGLLISIPIQNGSWGAVINWDCTGWKSLLAFAALVMATKKKAWEKIKALVFFLPLIFVINVFRIFFMFLYVRTWDLAYYDVVHTFVWSWGLIAAVLAFWIVWMKKTN